MEVEIGRVRVGSDVGRKEEGSVEKKRSGERTWIVGREKR